MPGPYFHISQGFVQGVAAVLPRGINGDFPFRDLLMISAAVSLFVTPEHPAVQRVPQEVERCPANDTGHCSCWGTGKDGGRCHYCGATTK